MERIPPGELTLEQLDALAAEGRIGLDRYWQLREYVERRAADAASADAFALPPVPDPSDPGPGFVPPPPRRAAAPEPPPPPAPFVAPPPPAAGPPGWVRLDVPGPSAEAAPTRANDRRRRRRRRG